MDRLLQSEGGRALLEAYPRSVVVDALRQVLSESREAPSTDRSEEALADRAQHYVERQLRPSLRPAINATGVILHTNLGRAPLSEIGRAHV